MIFLTLQMDYSNQLQVLVRRKIPYLSSGLSWILGLLFIVLFLFAIIMSPTKYNSDEMKVAYYILVVPDWLKVSSFIAAVGLVITLQLYFSARLYKPALLTLNSEMVFIKGKDIDFEIAFGAIAKIYFNDLKDLLRRPKNKLEIAIEQKNKKILVFLLKNYNDGENAVSMLAKIDKAQFAFYDFDMPTIHEDE